MMTARYSGGYTQPGEPGAVDLNQPKAAMRLDFGQHSALEVREAKDPHGRPAK
jgi:hypothetical protein